MEVGRDQRRQTGMNQQARQSGCSRCKRPQINSEAEPAPSTPANAKPPDIASASVPDTLAALHVNPDTGLTHAEVDARRKEHGYNEVAETEGAPGPQVPPEVLGHLGVDARTDHGAVGRAREIFGPRRGERAAGRQRRVELHAGAPRRRRRRGAAATVAGQCARPARVELAGHSRPGAGPRRHRSRASRRHHPGGREAPHGSVERGPVGAHRRIEGRGQGARRRAVVGVRRPPRRGQRRGHADRGEDLLWPHHGARAAGATEAPHRSGGGQGRPLALCHRRRAAGRGGRPVARSAARRSSRWCRSCSCC